ncbi:hypothetical protein BXZ70DRAFT_1008870 [Cristinia sonorae]|uniref:C2 domain-containing protein n=1 Tax=Cristinia sonorae TaxID=1940300 RepID=A0A8K0UNB3_9AGAR|nr:hypothetical protein BXZ70DRAFT_1008870 [Cristinia sonorae]
MPVQFDPLEPWYLTIVRTQGIQFIRAEKSCRPIVSVNINGPLVDVTHETTLGSDGQNPNLKSPFILREIDTATYLDITVHHRPSGKHRKKRHLVGSSYITVGDVLRRQAHPGADVELKLSCPPPQKRSPTVGGNRQLGCASITIRLRSPTPLSAVASSSATLVDSRASSIHGEEDRDSDTPSTKARDSQFDDYFDDSTLIHQHPEPEPQQSLRRRRKPPRVKGYSINTSDEEDPLSSSSESMSCPPSPQPLYAEPLPWSKDASFSDDFFTPNGSQITIVRPPSEDWIAPRVLPRYVDQMSLAGSLSTAETVLDWFSPYKDLSGAGDDEEFEKVMGRLLTEWYVVGASLLAIAAVNAAVFGFSSEDTIFSVSTLAKKSIAMGSIAAGLGIVIDAWLLVMYSGASARKFQRLALDVYNTYFFFCLTCRLPTLALFVSAMALMVFLLTVAWEAWPTVVLVMSFLAGTLVGLQYVVWGVHRVGNGIVWVVRTIWLGTARLLGMGRKAGGGPAASLSPAQPSASASASAPAQSSSVVTSGGDDGVQMPEPDTDASGFVVAKPAPSAEPSVAPFV